jgi:hypothetical protein
MCGGTVGDTLDRTGIVSRPSAPSPVVGQPDTAKTQIGDSGAQAVAVAQRRKPRSLLSGTALGDVSAAAVAGAGAKPTLGA